MKDTTETTTWQKMLGIAEISIVIFLALYRHAQTPTKIANTIRQKQMAIPVSTGLSKEEELPSAESLQNVASGSEFNLRAIGNIAAKAARAWSLNRAASKGAALALYTLFSLAPMLVLVVAVAGLFFGADLVRQLLMERMVGVLGVQGAEAIKSILAGAHYERDSFTAALISTGLVLVGATSAFSELKDSLDELWGVSRKTNGGVWFLIRERFLSFGLVLVMALMLLISLAVNTALSFVGDYWVGGATNHSYLLFAKAATAVVSFSIVTGLFSVIYKYLPAVSIAWRDVVIGATITSVLFISGKFLIGLYLAKTNFSSGYGAAGSLVVLVAWIYYSAQVFFYGALFTHEHALTYGRTKVRARFIVS
jgi:membrane protein